jgi:hypothetical protein
MNDEIKNFVELPWDEFNNRGYTAGQAYVIKARVEPGKGKPGTLGSLPRLHVLEPKSIARKWPTLSGWYWKEVDHPAGPISQEEWLRLVEGED